MCVSSVCVLPSACVRAADIRIYISVSVATPGWTERRMRKRESFQCLKDCHVQYVPYRTLYSAARPLSSMPFFSHLFLFRQEAPLAGGLTRADQGPVVSRPIVCRWPLNFPALAHLPTASPIGCPSNAWLHHHVHCCFYFPKQQWSEAENFRLQGRIYTTELYGVSVDYTM